MSLAELRSQGANIFNHKTAAISQKPPSSPPPVIQRSGQVYSEAWEGSYASSESEMGESYVLEIEPLLS